MGGGELVASCSLPIGPTERWSPGSGNAPRPCCCWQPGPGEDGCQPSRQAQLEQEFRAAPDSRPPLGCPDGTCWEPHARLPHGEERGSGRLLSSGASTAGLAGWRGQGPPQPAPLSTRGETWGQGGPDRGSPPRKDPSKTCRPRDRVGGGSPRPGFCWSRECLSCSTSG